MSSEAGGGYFYPDSEDEAGYGDGPFCTWCDGEPYLQDCDDPLQCWCLGKGGHCPACNDTGLAKYQTVW